MFSKNDQWQERLNNNNSKSILNDSNVTADYLLHV